jgi:NhaP-type Na+/H+ or K+/H+ antiporter
MLFMLLGVLLSSSVLDVIHGPEDTRSIEILLEAALALVLFTDALEISSGDWRKKSRLPGRLLLVGMPLTMVVGWVLAAAMFGSMDIWEAALLSFCLAPTDAALGQAVVTDPRVPALVRQALNIESGLNDGLALPFVLIALGAAAEAENVAGAPGLLEVFFRSLVLAAAIGGATGWLGGRALRWSSTRGWVGREWTQIGTLGLVLLAFAAADAAGGSGFIATWVAGVAFGRTVKDRLEGVAVLTEDLGGLLATVAFLGYGAILLGPILPDIGWDSVLYAVLSLTVVRVVPVAISFAGTGLARQTVLYAGWFGPRGLASIVFALLVAEGALPGGSIVVEVILVTVALSVILHGGTAVVGAQRYAHWFDHAVASNPEVPEAEDVGEPQVRRRLVTHGEARHPRM